MKPTVPADLDFEEDAYPPAWHNPNYAHENPKSGKPISSASWIYQGNHVRLKIKAWFVCTKCFKRSLVNRYAVRTRNPKCKKCVK